MNPAYCARGGGLLLICLLVLSVLDAAAAASRTFDGPLELHQALKFYVVNEAGADFTIHLGWRSDWQAQMDCPLLARVFDPEERLILRHEDPGEKTAGAAPPHQVELNVTASGAGVYEIVVTSFGGPLEFSTTPALPWGVLGHPRLVGHGDQFAQAYIYLPPKLDNLPIRCEGVVNELKLTDESGAARIEAHGANAAGQAPLLADGEHVWMLSVKAPGEYALDFGGLPIILCPDPHTARAIHASVDVLDDGTICFHKFQVRAQRVLQRYRAMPQSVFQVAVPELLRYRNHWLADPDRNYLLMGGYGVYAVMPATLREQNLDPASPWFGTIFAWKDADGRARPQNPWADYARLGLNRVAAQVSVLGAVYSIDEPFNPLFKSEALRARIIIASLQELMLLREHELPMSLVPENYFGGERAFTFSSFLRTFPWVVADCPIDARVVWTEGLRRYVDHESISQVASTSNQWTFIIKGLQHFYNGTGEATYGQLVQRHLRWLLTRNQFGMGWMPAGYFFESGPDSTYNGISTHNLGWVYEQTRDVVLGKALERCIDLFNHTIAPQPDGTWLGASNFCTRTPGNWSQPQFGGGMGMLGDDFAEAGLHTGREWPLPAAPARTVAERRAAEQRLLQNLHYLGFSAYTDKDAGAALIADGPNMHFAVWEHFAAAPLTGQLPMAAQRNFTRNFGDEFFCVRRPGYYAFVYAGKPVPTWQQSKRPADAHRQHPRNGGGLSMFWSPSFGSSLLAQNWSAYAAQTLIAEHDDNSGAADWEDYWSIQSAFDEQHAQATITGTLRDQPLDFRRQYQFLDDRVMCDVTIHAPVGGAGGVGGAAKFRAMWECFPYPIPGPSGGGASLRVILLDAQGRPVQDRPPATASAIMFQDGGGGGAGGGAGGGGSPEVHLVVFAQPRLCQIGVDHSIDSRDQPHEWGRVLAAVPQPPQGWEAGEERAVRWCVLAVPGEQTAVAVRQAVRSMAR